MFKMCVAGGSENVGKVCIGCACIGHCDVITRLLCVVRVEKMARSSLRQSCTIYIGGNRKNLASGFETF